MTVTWAGPDGEPGTADDVVITVTTRADGTYRVTDLPDGSYTVVFDDGTFPAGTIAGWDTDRGDPLVTHVRVVDGGLVEGVDHVLHVVPADPADPADPTVPVDPADPADPPGAADAADGTPSDRLPLTGAAVAGAVAVALLFLVAGAALLVTSRRRLTEPR